MNAAPWILTVAGLGVWATLVGTLAPEHLALGLPVALSAWWLFDRVLEPARPLPARRALPLLLATARYGLAHVLPEMAVSTARVFGRALAPHPRFAPAIVAVPLPDASHEALLMLAYGISLTPGQQILAMEGTTLYVHAIDAPDPEAVVREIQATYERYIKEATQW